MPRRERLQRLIRPHPVAVSASRRPESWAHRERVDEAITRTERGFQVTVRLDGLHAVMIDLRLEPAQFAHLLQCQPSRGRRRGRGGLGRLRARLTRIGALAARWRGHRLFMGAFGSPPIRPFFLGFRCL